jgi:uncharacterized protein (TIGR03492 family)
VTAILFVSNGHGEAAIARRIAAERALSDCTCDHLPLVGESAGDATLRTVGPRRAMPSGGLIAMGNVRNLARDLRSGLLGLTRDQWRFLRSAGERYAAVVAVGDVYALAMALAARRPTIFVGTAKSVAVAPYGFGERLVLRRAHRVFVRDPETARALRRSGIVAEAPGNVIADLHPPQDDGRLRELARDRRLVLLLPGSRAEAYGDAAMLCRVLGALSERTGGVMGLLSIAPGLDRERMAAAIRAAGFDVEPRADVETPFAVHSGAQSLAVAWCGALGAALASATVVIGQAGTANEAAAATGIPVVACAAGRGRDRWYRYRQQCLLDGAMLLVPGDPDRAANDLAALLDDEERRARMGAIGRARMGPPGGAAAIAAAIRAACEG